MTVPWMTPDRWIGWLPFAVHRGKAILRRNSVDVIYSSGPPWTNHLVASRLSRASSIPWVADFRDPWLGNAFRANRNGTSWTARKHQTLEKSVYRDAAVVIFNTERAKQNAIERIGDELSSKSMVIPNGFDPAQFPESLFSSPRAETRSGLRMTHAGTFYGKRNVNALLNVIGKLKKNGQLGDEDLQLELIGRVRREEQQLIDHLDIAGNVNLIPPLPHAECLQRLAQSDVLLLVQTEAPLCIPGKLYEYIAIRKPILTLASEGATADLVRSRRLGHCVDPADETRLEKSLLKIIKAHQSGSLRPPALEIRNQFDGRQQMILFDRAFRTAMSPTLSAGE